MLPGLAPGELLNIVGGAPDGSLVYAVVAAASNDGAAGSGGAAASNGHPLREGWVPGSAIEVLSPAEAAALPDSARLPMREVLRRTTLARATEPWQDADEPSSLELRADDVLQLSTVREGWGYGWPVATPSRRGWFPLAFVQMLESSVQSLVRDDMEEELSAGAATAILDLLRSAQQPPPREWAWEGELPAAVAESARQSERSFREYLERQEAELAAQEQEPDGGGDAPPDRGQPEEQEEELNLLSTELPEDCYPLYVCRTNFKPPAIAEGAMLSLTVGDLVRVTSITDAQMYFGFKDAQPSDRGWFPRGNVDLLDDPLQEGADDLPVQLGVPPLPEVPPHLRRNAGT